MARRSANAWRIVRDLGGMLWSTRRWWLAPLVFACLVAAAALAAGASPVGAFMYSLV